jgi:selenocysteine-specific elongation factor
VRHREWQACTLSDATLSVLPSYPEPLARRGNHHLHVGSAHLRAQLRVLGASAVEPGTTGLVRVHLPSPLPLVMGDRYLLRDGGRAETLGGGEILDVAPVLSATRARPDRSVRRVVAEHGWIEVDLLRRLTGVAVRPTLGRWAVSAEARAAAERGCRRTSSEQVLSGWRPAPYPKKTVCCWPKCLAPVCRAAATSAPATRPTCSGSTRW